MIIHNTVTNTEKVCKLYSENEGVDIKYVCTSEINGNNIPCDIFHRSIPHPEFGNQYFAISHGYIMNADTIDGELISCIPDSNGDLHYSRYRHDFVTTDLGYSIDGGREYLKVVGNESGVPPVTTFKIKDGDLVIV